MFEPNKYLVIACVAAVGLWILTAIVLALLMLANRKEKDGFLVGEIGSKTGGRLAPINAFFPLWFFLSGSYTEKGNRYRKVFWLTSLWGFVAFIGLAIAVMLLFGPPASRT